ncbi:hypothetical protein [Flavobacterium sp.]|uniref:hypothetical protein n=1 Tax=Flavobacterium sp. TaxID=239 RepID=UPI0026143065|nr:hypothetical protein [Flavobacterium sp.]
MSKKKINIALLIVVLALWGTVGYKTISQYFFSKELAFNDVKLNTKLNFNQIKKDTFNLESIQRDPFLNNNSEPPTNTEVVKKVYLPKKVVSKPVAAPKPVLQWPAIFYYGYIKSKDKTEELILVKIDRQLHKLRKNDQIDGLTIKKVFNDSIEVSFYKEKKIIKVNNK